MTRNKTALDLFSKGFNCSQAVIGAFCEEHGMDKATALKLATSFGGGMRQAEVCGAVTGALMVLGLNRGHSIEGDTATKKKAYEATRQFNTAFRERCGSLRCRELLGYDLSNEDEYRVITEKGLFSTVCPKMITAAVEILEQSFLSE